VRRVTTHWAYVQELQRRFHKVRVEMDRIFIADGSIWTSAGMTAGLDMALGLIERDMGAGVARATARMMVVHHRRLEVNLSIRPCLFPNQSRHSGVFAASQICQPLALKDLSRRHKDLL
jgi:transcriptional regulator GlxA family with amidase domain